MKNLVVFIFILWGHCTFAQNLITNPSFEEIDSCYGQPSDIGDDVFEWSGCLGWSNPIAASSDLWCENPIVGNQSPPFIPGLAYQYPRTGENMAGILVNPGIIFNYREYIQNEMQSQLGQKVKYHIEFYVSANGYDCLTSQFGVKFFSDKYMSPSELWLTQLIPDAISDPANFVGDTSIWQKVEMEYVANGSEKFVVIGNFQDSLSMSYTLPCDTSFWGNLTLGGGYFLIDDVSIVEMPVFASIPNVFTPNNDGVNDLFEFEVVNCDRWEMVILNRWGNQVAILDEQNPTWDGSDCTEGTYFYRVNGSNCNLEQQGYFQLIR